MSLIQRRNVPPSIFFFLGGGGGGCMPVRIFLTLSQKFETRRGVVKLNKM